MFDREARQNIIVIVGTIFAFNTLPKFPLIGQFFEDQPIVIFILAILLIANSGKIADKIKIGEK